MIRKLANEPMKYAPFFVTVCVGLSMTASADEESKKELGLRSYLPQPVVGEADSYRHTDEQRARMARSPLQAERFVPYIEHLWSLKRLRAYCVPKNVMPKDVQNLVVEHLALKTDLFQGQDTGFDRISVYVDDDDGRATYVGKASQTQWHRWTYSLNVKRGKDFWVIIATLPNDFMDSEEYRAKH